MDIDKARIAYRLCRPFTHKNPCQRQPIGDPIGDDDRMKSKNKQKQKRKQT